MFKKIVAASLLMAITTIAPATTYAADWEFAGNWQVKVTCKGFNQVNTLRISRADSKKVTGTTNVGEGFGKIGSGEFDGENVIFVNKYKWDGKTYSETWVGKLSRKGKYLSGAFTTTNKESSGCKFRGPKI